MAKAERYISDRFCVTRWCSVNRHSDRSGSELVGKRTGTQPPTALAKPRIQASSRYPSYQRRLGTECDSANFPNKLDR